MPSSVYQQLNNSNNNINFFQDLTNQFNEFRKTLQGDPEQIGLQLLKSGRMSQQDYNYLRQMALQIKPFLFKN